jgi:molybdopterin-guanine dinucleotide biosynthesis protein A/molybdopterin converting factor small subunit
MNGGFFSRIMIGISPADVIDNLYSRPEAARIVMSAQELRDGAAAVVLAGGRSSRMGQPKAMLRFAGEPLVSHLVRRLKTVFDGIVVVAAPGQELPAVPAKVVHDEVPYRGPVGGIYYGVTAAEATLSFVTSCDAPFLNLALISHIIAQAPGYDVVVPYWQERFQPLHAVYRASVLPFLREQLERNELRPISVYDKVRTRKISEEEIRRFDPEGLSFLNMNTQAEYEAALALWQTRRAVPVTVELFGVARLLAKTSKISLELMADATLSELISSLAERLPVLVGQVIEPETRGLTRGHACNINGQAFVRDLSTKIHCGDNVFILSADAGG